MYDTGGGERVNSMTNQYYKNSQIVCLVYAFDSDISFHALGKWIEDARFYLEESQRHSRTVFALVGVKGDISIYEREVKPDDVKSAARHFNIPRDCCFEVSNVTGEGVEHMMQHLVQKVFDLHTKRASQSATELQDYSTDSVEPHNTDSATGGTEHLKHWLCYCCCYCCRRCTRRLEGYQHIQST